jgi:DNA-binding CsgD family transcriptional regulator
VDEPNAEIEQARCVHAHYFLAFAEAVDARVWGVESPHLLGRFATDLQNIRAALSWTEKTDETALGLRLVTALWLFWQTTGLVDEGFAWLDRALARHRDPSVERAAGLTVAGYLAWFRDDLAAASSMLDEAMRYWRAIGHVPGMGRARFAQVLIAWRQGAFERAVTLLGESRAQFEANNDTVGPSLCLIVEAILARNGGQLDEALRLLAEAGSLAAFSDFIWGIAIAHYYEGEVNADRGDYKAALTAYRASLATAWRIRDRWTTGVVMDGIAIIWALQGELLRAARLFGAADHLRGRTAALIPVVDRQMHTRVMNAVRANLDENEFSVAYDAGAALSPEDANTEAMQDGVRVKDEAALSIELTPRERDVLRLLIEGFTDVEIANELRLSSRTISEYVGNVLKKTGRTTRTALAVYVVRTSLI